MSFSSHVNSRRKRKCWIKITTTIKSDGDNKKAVSNFDISLLFPLRSCQVSNAYIRSSN